MTSLSNRRDGASFYHQAGQVQWENVFGVLVTMILLTLGGSTWFKILMTAVTFRDLLSPVQDGKNGTARNAGAGAAGKKKKKKK